MGARAGKDPASARPIGGEPRTSGTSREKEIRAMTVRSARGVVFQGVSMLAMVCVAGCGGGRGDGHQVKGGDAAAEALPPVEGAGGGGDYLPTEARGRTADAGIAQSGVAGAAGSTARAVRPSEDAGS